MIGCFVPIDLTTPPASMRPLQGQGAEEAEVDTEEIAPPALDALESVWNPGYFVLLVPHPLRFCAGTATSSQPSTMAARTGAQADLRRRRTSVSSLYAWRERTRRGDIRACGAHSRTSNTDTKLLIYGVHRQNCSAHEIKDLRSA